MSWRQRTYEKVEDDKNKTTKYKGREMRNKDAFRHLCCVIGDAGQANKDVSRGLKY